MFLPVWGLVVGGILSLVGAVTTLIHLPQIIGAILEGIGDVFD